MKTFLSSTVLLTSLLVSGAATVLAQSPRPSSSATSRSVVAVLDVAKVFKNHPRFKYQIEEIKREIKSFEGEVNKKRQAITNLSKDLDQFNSGSPEYRQIETKLAKDTSDIQVEAQLKRKKILDREARIYYETYQDILDIVSRIADHHGISVVLRYDSDPIDPADRSQVLKGVNRTVVFQRNLDLTTVVLEQVERGQARDPPSTQLR